MSKDVFVMIPGPTPVVKPIRDQMAREMQAFGDPRFVADYKALIEDLRHMLNCSGACFPLAGTGTLAMEMAIANSTKRGNRVLVVSHGFFGDRFEDLCSRRGIEVDVLRAQWGQAVPLAEIRAKLASQPYAALTVSHVDTSTAVVAPIADIGALMKEFPDTLYIVDGVAATAGEYADVDAMGIDILFTGSQKAFGVCPGMFILWASQKALARRKALGQIPDYYVDFEKWLPIMENPAKYFATPAVNLVWALQESVRLINEEGYKARCERHSKNGRAMAAALEAIGLKLLAAEGLRASTLSCLLYPQGVDDAKFRAALFDEGVIVGGGLAAYAGKMFRLGHMGHITINDEVAVLGAIERALKACGHSFEMGKSLSVYLSHMT